MEPEIIAAIIGVLGALIAAVLGGVVGRSELIDRMRQGSKFWSLRGEWESTWQDLEAPHASFAEVLVIERQKGTRVYGYITMHDEPNKRWDVEGVFSGRFLQLLYSPSESAADTLFLDYGCYFFELKGDGSFDGLSIGFSWDSNRIGASKHQLSRRGRRAQAKPRTESETAPA